MSFFLSSQFLLDDDVDDADGFDLDFDEDYEFLSDEEFEVFIEYDEHDLNDLDISEDEFCMEEDIDDFSNFDSSEDTLAEKDYADEE